MGLAVGFFLGIISDIKLARAPMAGLAVVGLYWGSFAGLMPDIKAAAGVSDGQFGMALALSAIGSITSMFLAPRFFNWAGRQAIPAASVTLIGGMLLLLVAGDSLRLAVVLVALGAMVGMLDICSNIRISIIETRKGRGFMNGSHAMFSFAFGFSALVSAIFRDAGFGPKEVLPGMALVALIFVWLAYEQEFAPLEDGEAGGTDYRPSRRFWPAVLLTALVLFSSFVGENSVEAWSALHIERTLGADAGHGSLGPAILGLTMGMARLGGQAFVHRIGEGQIILVSAVLGVLGISLIALAWSPNVVIAGVGIVALGMASIVPSVNTVLGRRVRPSMQGLALSRAWMIGMAGFFVGPAFVGLVAESFGLRVAYAASAGVVALIIPAVVALARIERNEEALSR